VLLLRLAEFVATGNADVFQQCLWLLGVSGLDRERVGKRAGEESLGRSLDALEQVAATLDQDVAKLEIWEITDLAKSLHAAHEER
jgi:hypothetical protein